MAHFPLQAIRLLAALLAIIVLGHIYDSLCLVINSIILPLDGSLVRPHHRRSSGLVAITLVDISLW